MRFALASVLSITCCVAAELPAVPAPLPSIRVPQALIRPAMTAAADDPAWAAAVVIPALGASVKRDRAVAPVLQATQIRLLWDAESLYVRCEAVDDEIYVPHAEHDADLYQGDVAEVFLDVVGDARQYFELQVSPNNATLDQTILVTAPEPRSDADGLLVDTIRGRDLWFDRSYTMPGLRSAAAIRGSGWMVEFAIPAAAALHRLGTSSWTAGQQLRANVLRYDRPLLPGEKSPAGKRSLTAMNWAPVMDGCPHMSPQAMGKLELVGR